MKHTEITLFGFPIRAETERLDAGIFVLLTGGCRTHVGAVSTAEPDGTVRTQTFPGHKDHLLSEPWAAALAEKTGTRACVVCGIHYDNAAKDQIAEIVARTDEMLRAILEDL